MSQAVIDGKVALLAFPSHRAQSTSKASLKPATRHRKVRAACPFSYEFVSQRSGSCTQVRRAKANMTGVNSYQKSQMAHMSSYFAAYDSLAHFTPITVPP